jgi:hypothetical protein
MIFCFKRWDTSDLISQSIEHPVADSEPRYTSQTTISPVLGVFQDNAELEKNRISKFPYIQQQITSALLWRDHDKHT